MWVREPTDSEAFAPLCIVQLDGSQPGVLQEACDLRLLQQVLRTPADILTVQSGTNAVGGGGTQLEHTHSDCYKICSKK